MMVTTTSTNMQVIVLFLVACAVQALNLETPPSTRRGWIQNMAAGAVGSSAVAATTLLMPDSANAAPPIAVIAEELGYFPVQNREGEFVYISKKITRPSTDQAIELAKTLQNQGVTMYGAYWCPHCARQKEVFGKEAWALINYVECAPKGYGFRGICKDVDGYPSWKNKRGKEIIGGEAPLEMIATTVGFSGFDASLEDSVPLIGTSCKIR